MSLKNLSVKIKIPKILNDHLKNKRVNQIYKKFEKNLNISENFGVGVSGGPDSLSLAFLSKVYSIKNRVEAKFFIVDHRIKKESTVEEKLVQKILKKIFINSKILTWKGKKTKKNIQSLARKKRYELMYAECDKNKMDNLLIGHHQDDLFENFFIRMLRGSGLKGLVSLDKVTKMGGKRILRPLLDQRKQDLVFLSKNIFNFYVEDPSNKDEKFQRTRVRKLIFDLQNNGLEEKKFHKTIKNLKNSNTVVDFYVDENIKKNTFFLEKKDKIFLNKFFFNQPNEIIFKALSKTIKLIRKKYYSVRGKKLDKIINDIKNHAYFKSTLGGCVIEKVHQTVIISKER